MFVALEKRPGEKPRTPGGLTTFPGSGQAVACLLTTTVDSWAQESGGVTLCPVATIWPLSLLLALAPSQSPPWLVLDPPKAHVPPRGGVSTQIPLPRAGARAPSQTGLRGRAVTWPGCRWGDGAPWCLEGRSCPARLCTWHLTGCSERRQPLCWGGASRPIFSLKNDSDDSQKPSFSCWFPRISLRH